MKTKNMPQNYKKESAKRGHAPFSRRHYLLILVCGAALLAGFFFAARQHFSAIEYGIRNAKLHQQKNSLETERQQLYLEREISFSPAEIKKVAKKIGLQDFTMNSIEAVKTKLAAVKQAGEKSVNDKIRQVFSDKSPNAPASKQTNGNAPSKEVKNTPNDNRQTAKKPDVKLEARETAR